MHEIQRDIRHADSQCGLIVNCTGKVSEVCTQIRRSRTVNTRQQFRDSRTLVCMIMHLRNHGDTVYCERLVVGHCVDDEYVVVSLNWDFLCVDVSIANPHAIVWWQLLDVGLSWIFKSPTSMCFHNCPRATGQQPSSRVRVEQLTNDVVGVPPLDTWCFLPACSPSGAGGLDPSCNRTRTGLWVVDEPFGSLSVSDPIFVSLWFASVARTALDRCWSRFRLCLVCHGRPSSPPRRPSTSKSVMRLHGRRWGISVARPRHAQVRVPHVRLWFALRGSTVQASGRSRDGRVSGPS